MFLQFAKTTFENLRPNWTKLSITEYLLLSILAVLLAGYERVRDSSSGGQDRFGNHIGSDSR